MKYNKNIISQLNLLVQSEYRSSFNYLEASNWFQLNNLPGISSYFKTQSNDERSHAILVMDHLIALGIHPQIPHEFDTNLPVKLIGKFHKPLEFFEFSNLTEKTLLNQMNEIAIDCQQHQDFLTLQFIQNRMAYQLNEFNNSEILLAKVKAYSAMQGLIYHLDKELK